MTDLIETVARAICASNGEDPNEIDQEDRDKVCLWEHYVADAINALRAIEASGYRIVPVEPTEEMLKASSRGDANRAGVYYRAMLAAAPKVVP